MSDRWECEALGCTEPVVAKMVTPWGSPLACVEHAKSVMEASESRSGPGMDWVREWWRAQPDADAPE